MLASQGWGVGGGTCWSRSQDRLRLHWASTDPGGQAAPSSPSPRACCDLFKQAPVIGYAGWFCLSIINSVMMDFCTHKSEYLFLEVEVSGSGIVVSKSMNTFKPS